jgi:hypothetical protein
VLRGLAKRHALLASGDAATPRKVNRGTSTGALNLKIFLGIMEKARDDHKQGETFSSHKAVKFIITAIDIDNMFYVSHMTGEGDNKCYGRVIDGKCFRCGDSTSGVPVYSFDMDIADYNNDKLTLAIRIGEKGANDILGVTAREWRRIEKEEKNERLGKLWFMPHTATIGFSIDKNGVEKITLRDIVAVAQNA